MAEKVIFPVYTRVSNQPVTIFQPLGPDGFNYPFFNQGVHQTRLPAINTKQYQWEDLQIERNPDLLSLKGFIFHTSHCGSTLLARMLGSLPGVRVVSETEAINGLLLSAVFYQIPEKDLLFHLQRIMEAYRQPLKEEKALIFKLTSWNVFFIGLFQQLYPQVPWLYLDRETEDVVKSLLAKGRGFAEWWDHPVDVLRRYFVGEDFICADKEGYFRQMVKKHRYHAHKHIHSNACFLNYPEFILAFEETILPHFNLQFSEKQVRAAKEITKYDAKRFEKTLFANCDKK